tara:strand:+ start:579 stop:770 length:192 start_codon:yes stop_codon:yes gene_type:complete
MKQYMSAPLVTDASVFSPKVALQTKKMIEIGKNFCFIPIGMILKQLSILNYLFFLLLSSFSLY